MKTLTIFGVPIPVLAVAPILFGSLSVAHARRTVVDFDADWRFSLGECDAAMSVGHDDSGWRPVHLPHDWAISGPFDPKVLGDKGKLPWQGVGWYRKSFSLADEDQGRRVYLDFGGAMAFPQVYINGRLAGSWEYGYMSFRIDATDFVRFGRENVVAVRCDTRKHGTRWYPGAGIYRKVVLTLCDPVHVAHWGTYVTTPEVSDKTAKVRVRTTVANDRPSGTPEDGTPASAPRIEVRTVLLDPAGMAVAETTSTVSVPGGSASEIDQTLAVPDPLRWDVRTPRLYTARTVLRHSGRDCDTVDTTFGIRTFRFTPDDGFHLNGRRVQLNGVNLHHGHGPLGAAFFPRAMERQLRIMQDMGANAIRTSHNPPATELLELCDRMGILVYDELFDKWNATAGLLDGDDFESYMTRQSEAFLRRDRNHPCIIAWSVGNEMADTATTPEGVRQITFMTGLFKSLEPTRPVTLADYRGKPVCESGALDTLDITSWNYGGIYSHGRKHYPDKPIVYSESASAFSTRGFYTLPHPAKRTDYDHPGKYIDSYDLNSASGKRDIPDRDFRRMETDRHVAGEFVWTGFDYLGEPAPFWHEARSSYFGIVDLVGIPKDRYFLYRSHWAPAKTTVHILPHWNWPERIGKPVPVFVYTNGDSAELFLNGKSLGRRNKSTTAEISGDSYYDIIDRYRLHWDEVTYAPGELKAVAYRDGTVIGEAVMRTATAPEAIRLTPEWTDARADGGDLWYVLAEAVDRAGTVCPLANHMLEFEIDGPAVIAGIGNGDQRGLDPFTDDRHPLFFGKAMLILRSKAGSPGKVTVTATATHLRAGTTKLRAIPGGGGSSPPNPPHQH